MTNRKNMFSNNKLFQDQAEAMPYLIKAAEDTGNWSDKMDPLKAVFILKAWTPMKLRANKKPVDIPALVGVRHQGTPYFFDDAGKLRQVNNHDFAINLLDGQGGREWHHVLKNLLHKDKVKKLWFDQYTAEITTKTGDVLYFITKHIPRAYWGEAIHLEGADQIKQLKSLIK